MSTVTRQKPSKARVVAKPAIEIAGSKRRGDADRDPRGRVEGLRPPLGCGGRRAARSDGLRRQGPGDHDHGPHSRVFQGSLRSVRRCRMQRTGNSPQPRRTRRPGNGPSFRVAWRPINVTTSCPRSWPPMRDRGPSDRWISPTIPTPTWRSRSTSHSPRSTGRVSTRACKSPRSGGSTGDDVTIQQLGEDGTYVRAEMSRFLPVKAVEIRRWIVEEDSNDQTAWFRRLRAWLRRISRTRKPQAKRPRRRKNDA